MLMVLKINALEVLAGVSVNYEKNTCDWPSTRKKAVLIIQIPLRDMIHNSISLILLEHSHKNATVQTLAVFWTP